MVDEYQDTNSLQFADCLLTEKQQTLLLWEMRPVDLQVAALTSPTFSFRSHFPTPKQFGSNKIIAPRKPFSMSRAQSLANIERKGKTCGLRIRRVTRVRYFQALNAESEARFVGASKILEHRDEEYDLRAAVLYRTNSQSQQLRGATASSGPAYNIVGGFSFYERMEVRDIIAYLKLALNPTIRLP